MRRNRDPRPDHGDTGEWFLHLTDPVAVQAAPPPGSHADDGAGLQASPATAVAHQPGPTRPVHPDDPLATWTPERLDRLVESRRPFRWSIAVIAVLIGALGWIVLAFLPGVGERRAADQAETYRTVLAETDTVLADLDNAAARLADPAAAIDDLNALVAAARSGAVSVTAAATAELPAVPPFSSSAPVDGLRPARQRLADLALALTTAADDLAAALDYRSGVQRIVSLPTLPVQDDADGIAELSVGLASHGADAVGAAAALPSDPAFATHRSGLDKFVLRFELWQVEYLDALRRADAEAARTLVTEIRSSAAAVEAGLWPVLAAAGDAGGERVETLHRDRVRTEGLLP